MSHTAPRFLRLSALTGLLTRYASVFRLTWQHRQQLDGPQRSADELAFLPAALSLQETPVHPAPRVAALTICALFVITVVWACFGQIDVVAVAPGRIIVNEHTKTIQPLEAGVVTAIHVQEGDTVTAGQLLVELDATAAKADTHRLEQDRVAAASETLRTQALLQQLQRNKDGPTPALLAASGDLHLNTADRLIAEQQLQSEWQDISAKLARWDAEHAHRTAEKVTAQQSIEKLQTSLPLLKQRETDIQTLADQGFMAHHSSQDRTRERLELERDLSTAQAKLNEVQAALRESEQNLLSYRAETLKTLQERHNQAELKLRQLRDESTKTAQRTQLTRLTAPVSGTVQQLAVHTTGGVVTPAQVLMVLVPRDAQVIAEVTLDNKDIGYVQAGQSAAIKLEAFPYTRYGTVDATVKTISADAVVDEKKGGVFTALLTLSKSTLTAEHQAIPILPGMNITTEIKTNRRHIIEYLTEPILRHMHESFGER